MFKKNAFKILAIVFFLLSGVTFIYSNKTTNKKIINKKQVVKKTISPTKILTPTIFVKGSENPTPTIRSAQTPNLGLSTQPSPTSYPLPTTTSLSVSLSINGSSVGSFEIPQGSNQCDILTQALSQGKIQSLNMRYNSDYGTNAVYQINGIGKDNAVWWGFKVNGQSPSQGCSYIKVNSGDSVLWEYVGN